jgi:hypothetical protein
MRQRTLVRLCVILALSVAGAITSGCSAQAPETPAAPAFPDWGGLWENQDGFLYTRPGGKPNPPPLTPEFAALYKVVTDAAAAGRPVNDPTANCVWPGVPRVIVAPYPTEFLIGTDRVTIINEYMSQVRRVWTDGRSHPEDLEPSFNGHSIGHWEGDTLVVETVGLRDDTMIEQSGLPHSSELKVTERIRLTGPDALENEITMIDPRAFTQPWTTTIHFARHRDWQILDYVCAENNRNPVSATGKTLTLGSDGQPIDKEH